MTRRFIKWLTHTTHSRNNRRPGTSSYCARMVSSLAIAGAALSCHSSTILPEAVAGGAIGASTPTKTSHTGKGTQACPSTVVVAARGSEQNEPEDVIPTRYSPESPYISTGYEAINIRGFLQEAERAHLQHTGTSLLKDVPVIGIGPEYYKAALPIPALAKEGEQLTLEQTAQRAAALLNRTPLHTLIGNAVNGLTESVTQGIPGSLRAIDDYEAHTGCKPQYVLMGYSQGAAIIGAHEHTLAQRGQLKGVAYIGNPMHKLPNHTWYQPGTANRISYCLPGDFVCDTSPQALANSAGDEGGVHATYFVNSTKTTTQQAQASNTAAAAELAKMISTPK